MGIYKIDVSASAQADIEDLLHYSLETFGSRQMIKYFDELNQTLKLISESPEIGHHRKDIPVPCRARTFGKHVIIYEVMVKHIRVYRILHSRMNFPDQF